MGCGSCKSVICFLRSNISASFVDFEFSGDVLAPSCLKVVCRALGPGYESYITYRTMGAIACVDLMSTNRSDGDRHYFSQIIY